MARLAQLGPERLSALSLAGSSWLLVEPPFAAALPGLDTIVLDLQRRGYGVVLAHPERCHAFHRDRSMLDSLVGAGILTSVTAGSLVGRFGRGVRRFALGLVQDRLVHNVASDAHNQTGRPPGMAVELQEAGLDALSGWLTCQVPAAILQGRQVPREPLRPKKRRSVPWLLRSPPRQP
jgi:protein-tyrosine phosphatase